MIGISKKVIAVLVLAMSLVPITQIHAEEEPYGREQAKEDLTGLLFACLYLLERENAAPKTGPVYASVLAKTHRVGGSFNIGRPEMFRLFLEVEKRGIERAIELGSAPIELLAKTCIPAMHLEVQ